jgi:hypothetical protein
MIKRKNIGTAGRHLVRWTSRDTGVFRGAAASGSKYVVTKVLSGGWEAYAVNKDGSKAYFGHESGRLYSSAAQAKRQIEQYEALAEKHRKERHARAAKTSDPKLRAILLSNGRKNSSTYGTRTPMRLIAKVEGSEVRIYRNTDWGEYVVKPSAKSRESSWYHTDDKADAVATAKLIAEGKRSNGKGSPRRKTAKKASAAYHRAAKSGTLHAYIEAGERAGRRASVKHTKKHARKARTSVGTRRKNGIHAMSPDGPRSVANKIAIEVPLRPGTLAYFDGIHGIVPVKVLQVNDSDITCLVTAKRHGYPKGYEGVFRLSGIVPRKALRKLKYGSHISPYKWIRSNGSKRKSAKRRNPSVLGRMMNWHGKRVLVVDVHGYGANQTADLRWTISGTSGSRNEVSGHKRNVPVSELSEV